MSFPEAHVIFCDDVRREDNGKLLILGTYLAGMHAQFLHPPVSYPRLTIMVFARWRNRDEQEPVVIETRLSNQPEVFSRTEIDPLSLADEINSPIGRGVLMTAFLDGLPLTDGAALEVHLTVAGETRLIGWMPFTVTFLMPPDQWPSHLQAEALRGGGGPPVADPPKHRRRRNKS